MTAARVPASAPATAAEAAALADRMAADERERERRRTAAAKRARFDAAAEVAEDAPRMRERKSDALKRWRDAAADPEAGIAQLFDAFQNLRIVTRECDGVARIAGSVLRNDAEDSAIHRGVGGLMETSDERRMFGSFVTALDDVIRARADAAGATAQANARTAIVTAGADAAAAID